MDEDKFDYEIKYIAPPIPPISEVVKVFKTTDNSKDEAIVKLKEHLGFEPDEIINIDEF